MNETKVDKLFSTSEALITSKPKTTNLLQVILYFIRLETSFI